MKILWLRVGFWALTSTIFLMPFLFSSIAQAQVKCSTYTDVYTGRAQAVFAMGYLEGVQAALTKEVADIIVPPSDRDHPVWWVIPGGGGGTVGKFADSLSSTCKKQPNVEILKAILASAVRREGSPKFGILMDRTTGNPAPNDHPNKIILSEPSLECVSYNNLDHATRDALLAGYFNGTEAYRIAMKERPYIPWMAWPLGTTPREIKLLVDKVCADPKDSSSTIRDILWVTTITLAVKQDSSRSKK